MNDKKKNIIWDILEELNILFLDNLINITKRGKINKEIPVGLTRKIKPNDIPDRIAFIFPLFLSKYHLDKNKKLSVLKDVSDKSIK